MRLAQDSCNTHSQADRLTGAMYCQEPYFKCVSMQACMCDGGMSRTLYSVNGTLFTIHFSATCLMISVWGEMGETNGYMRTENISRKNSEQL